MTLQNFLSRCLRVRSSESSWFMKHPSPLPQASYYSSVSEKLEPGLYVILGKYMYQCGRRLTAGSLTYISLSLGSRACHLQVIAPPSSDIFNCPRSSSSTLLLPACGYLGLNFILIYVWEMAFLPCVIRSSVWLQIWIEIVF